MALNQVILEGQLVSKAQTQGPTVEFVLAYRGGYDDRLAGSVPVRVSRRWRDLAAEVYATTPEDRVLLFGHLRGSPSQVVIDAVSLKRVVPLPPSQRILAAENDLVRDEDFPL